MSTEWNKTGGDRLPLYQFSEEQWGDFQRTVVKALNESQEPLLSVKELISRASGGKLVSDARLIAGQAGDYWQIGEETPEYLTKILELLRGIDLMQIQGKDRQNTLTELIAYYQLRLNNLQKTE